MTTDTNKEGGRRVPLGATYMTANAECTLPPLSVIVAINRHARGDWGEVCEEDRQSNEDALTHGGRLLSVYRTPDGVKFWIITEADRSATTVLLPEDY